ncbi:MAG: sensor histidine kinase [Xanthomonadales bacterium]|nr:sensor histidine kinase [Xanthomonadales bacterium]
MLARLNPMQLLRFAGLFTWGCMGVPLLIDLFQQDITGSDLVWWRICYLTFGICYWLLTRSPGARPRARWLHLLLLALLTVSAIGIGHFTESGLSGAFLIVIAGLLPWFLSLGWGLVWLVGQHSALIPVFLQIDGFDWISAPLQAVLLFGYSSFVFLTSVVARRQMDAREEQRRLNSELRATRALLAESSRLNERSRISRELHDLLGHHLTALSLNLEVATHLCEGKAREHVKQAQSLAKLLLSDVREAVSQLRQDDAIDLREALFSLVDGVPSLDVRLDVPADFRISDPGRAQVLLRATQEIITNAARHSGAQRLDLRIASDATGVRLEARDDGRGADAVSAGNGLRGMRERVAEFAGTLEIETAPGQGFALRLHLPVETPA